MGLLVWSLGVLSLGPLSLQQLREWFAQCTRLWSGVAEAGDSASRDSGAGGVGVTCLGGAGVTAGAGGTKGAAAAGHGGARTRGTGAPGTGSVGGPGGGGAGAGDPGAVDPGARGARAGGDVFGGPSAGGTVRPRPYFAPLLQQSGGPTERCEPESRPTSRVRAIRTSRCVPRKRPPPVPNTHAMALRPSSVPLLVPLPPPSESSLPTVPHPESDLAHAASRAVSRLLSTVDTDPFF
ncbi:unnamed protein product [Closterium sp. NIES-54]